ncbi:SAM-dependent chlorinase/fluorinase [Actinoplanes sp. NPDC051859]|uniref:SAM-dependent chlorinase/fluorinase n=1 Tax=Actinoplanes sp. NPDC051859 TaxID=3363909 RepID=UPI0037B582CE
MTVPPEADPVICLCAHVTEREITAALDAGASDVAAIRSVTGANLGCGECGDDLEDVLVASRTAPTRLLMVNGGKSEPIRVLDDEPDVEVTVLTEPRHRHLYPPEANVVLVEDVEDLETARKAVLAALAGRSIDRVYSPTERGQVVAAHLGAYLGVPGNSPAAAFACTHKFAMTRALQAAGIPVARAILLTSPEQLADRADELSWPVVLKPVVGSGSALTVVVRDRAELAELLSGPVGADLRACGHAIVAEEFVAMLDEYHCDGVVVGGTTVFALASRYLAPLLGRLDRPSGSMTVPVDDLARAEILRLHERVVRAVGLDHGATHVELFRTASGFVVGEIACRPPGGGIVEHVRRHSGVDLWRESVRAALGRPVRITPHFADGVSAHLHLPPAPGRVAHVTPADELRALPGVTEVDLRVRPGDVLPAATRSSQLAGLIHLRSSSSAQLEHQIRRVLDVYRLDIVPNPTTATDRSERPASSQRGTPVRRIVVVTDCTDVSFNEMCGAMYQEARAAAHHLAVELVPVQNFSEINAAFLTRLVADNYPEGTVIYTLVSKSDNVLDRHEVIWGETLGGLVFVGSNFGYFGWLARDQGVKRVYEVPNVPQTPFSGKTFIAPIVARLAMGDEAELSRHPYAEDRIEDIGMVPGTVVHVDNFGNAKVLADLGDLRHRDILSLHLGDRQLCDASFISSQIYLERTQGDVVCYRSTSFDHMTDIGMVRGNFADAHGVRVGDVLTWRVRETA